MTLYGPRLLKKQPDGAVGGEGLWTGSFERVWHGKIQGAMADLEKTVAKIESAATTSDIVLLGDRVECVVAAEFDDIPDFYEMWQTRDDWDSIVWVKEKEVSNAKI